MFSSFFHLKENPFGESQNLRLFYGSRIHLQTLSQVVASLQNGKSLVLVTGEVGTGKTLLCKVLLSLLEQSEARTAALFQPLLEGAELLAQLSEDFGLVSPGSNPLSLKQELDRLNSFFVDNAKAQKRTVILIDEAHKLTFAALETLRMLTNLETSSEKLVQVVLFAQTEIQTKLDTYQMRQVQQRMAPVSSLMPLQLEDMESYIRHRLEICGGTNFVRFEASALKAIFKKAKGYPRLVNFYCELALLMAESQQRRLIDASTLKAVLRENGPNAPAAPAPSSLSPWARAFKWEF